VQGISVLMSTASEYRQNALEAMKRALATFEEEEREDYLRMAAAWTALADGADKYDRGLDTVAPFEQPPSDPHAGKSEA
jgi:hypothetical protein